MHDNFDFNKSFNQTPILENYNLFTSDEVLKTVNVQSRFDRFIFRLRNIK